LVDRRIRGGSEFPAQIEAALGRAEVVVAVWSEASVNSPWVRDEAAEGRDSGRLIPVVIDSSRPPIGFRQYHTIDLSRWRGRTDERAWRELIDAVEGTLSPLEGSNRRADPPLRAVVPRRLVLPLALLLAIFAAVGLYARMYGAKAEPPSLAVLPFASSTTDGSPFQRSS
jgi:hypothetical protein